MPRPCVFVSHSLGGLIDRLHTAEYPRGVAGLVQVDALGEHFQDLLDAAQMAADADLNNQPIPELDYDPEQYDFSHAPPFDLPDDLPAGLTSALIELAWTHAQDEPAKLTPDAVHVTAECSGHYVMLTQPKLIIHQVQRSVRAVRRAGH